MTEYKIEQHEIK